MSSYEPKIKNISTIFKKNKTRPIILGVISIKGGVGKTTTTAYLSRVAAKLGLKTAAVELNWINNPNLASIVFEDIAHKGGINSFVTKEGINTSAFSQSAEFPDLLRYYLVRYDDWEKENTIDNDEETLDAQLKIINAFRGTDYDLVALDFPNYGSRRGGLIPMLETDHRVIVAERGNAAMSTVSKIAHGIVNLTRENYDIERAKQRILLINRVEEESSSLKRGIAYLFDERRVDKARREFERLKERLPEPGFFSDSVYYIQDLEDVTSATAVGDIAAIDRVEKFKKIMYPILGDVLSHATTYQKQRSKRK